MAVMPVLCDSCHQYGFGSLVCTRCGVMRKFEGDGIVNATTEASLEAKDAIRPHALSLRERVYDAIKASGAEGMTDDDVQAALDMGGSTQRPRRIELLDAQRIRQRGAVYNSDRRATRSGRKAVVWVAC